ncbi:MAG: PAS domain S-box protein [Anaerolineae bacterium]|nr:PAS domain S-box protein [Anaerolineae bacterium]
MTWQYASYIVLLVVSAILSIALAAWVWRRRSAPGATAVIIFMILAAVWSGAAAMEAASDTLANKIFWTKMLYFGSATSPVNWLVFALAYTGQQRLLTRRRIALLMLVPAIILAAVWTNEAHQLIWQNITLATDGLYPTMAFTRGPLYWVNVAYAYTVMVIATALMIRAFLRASRPYRMQAGTLLIAAFVPWAGNVLYMAGLSMDLTSVGFVVTGVIVILALFRYRLLDIVPVARDALIASMSDAVLVFDAQNRLVDLNRSAEKLIQQAAAKVIGQPIARVFPNRLDLLEEYQDVEEAHTELTLDTALGRRTFDLHISPLRDQRGHLTGRVLVLRDITTRAQAEEHARQQNSFLQHILESVSSPFYVINVADYSIEMANSAARALGISAGAKTTCYALTHRRDTPCEGEHPCPLMTVIQTKAPTVVEHIHYDQDGSPLNVEVHGYPVFDQQGNVIQMIEYSLDITKRKQVEEEVRKLSRAVEQSANTVVITDTSGNIEYVNPKFTQITGYTPEEALGNNPRILKSGNMPPEMYKTLWKTITTGDEWRGEFHNRKKNGDLYWEAASISPIKDNAGKITHYLAVKEDITERKAVEDALKQAHDRLSTLVQVETELIASLDLDYALDVALDAALRISRANAGFIGLMEDDRIRIVYLLGNYPAEMKDSYVPVEAETIMQAVREEQVVVRTDVEHYQRRVTVLPTTQAQMTLPLLSRERLIGILNLETKKSEFFTPEVVEFVKLLSAHAALAIDNARLYESRAALIEDLDAFAHTVAHDLKNPLNVIMAYSSMLEESSEFPLPEQMRQQALRTIVSGSEKMNSIINALLLLAGVRKMGSVDTSRLDMHQITAEVIQRMESMIANYQAEIVLPDSWLEAMGYAPWVEEVFANYLSNALKYGGRPPYVELGSEALPDGMVRFWVRDNGPGLTPEQQSQLFTPFTRLKQVEVEGHGLGLSIVRRIVEKLGGTVGVSSAVGEGSVFSFTLPGITDNEM